MESKNITCDFLKNEYQYTIDPCNSAYSCSVAYAHISARFELNLEKYGFCEKIKEMKELLHNKGDILDKNKIELYKKTIQEMFDDIEKMKKKEKFDYKQNSSILGGLTYNYEHHMDKPGAKEMYLKIGKSIIAEEVKKIIHYHKKLILYNEEIINIKKSLSN